MYLDGRVGGGGTSLGITGPDVWEARGFGPALVVTGDRAGLGLMTAMKSGLGSRSNSSSGSSAKPRFSGGDRACPPTGVEVLELR